jgi:hypothetical protein
MSPGHPPTKTVAAACRDFAPSSQHEQLHSSFTHSPARLLPQPYPATPVPETLPLPSKSGLKRVQQRHLHSPSSPAAAAAAAVAASAHAGPVVSPLKASLVVQPAARVASPAKVARVAAAAAVTAEHASRAGLPLPQLRSPGRATKDEGDSQQQQQEARHRLQGHSEQQPAMPEHPTRSPARYREPSAYHAAESASKLLRDLDSSGGGMSSVENGDSVLNGGGSVVGSGLRAALPLRVTSREQLLRWMQVRVGDAASLG